MVGKKGKRGGGRAGVLSRGTWGFHFWPSFGRALLDQCSAGIEPIHCAQPVASGPSSGDGRGVVFLSGTPYTPPCGLHRISTLYRLRTHTHTSHTQHHHHHTSQAAAKQPVCLWCVCCVRMCALLRTYICSSSQYVVNQFCKPCLALLQWHTPLPPLLVPAEFTSRSNMVAKQAYARKKS